MISQTNPDPDHVIIGSYSNSQPLPSLYDYVTKDMTALKINIPLTNPSYVFVRNSHFYVVQQTQDGRLTVINNKYELLKSIQTSGNDPCHISMNSKGNRLVVTNYSSGSFIMYQIKDYLPTQVLSFTLHEGSSTNTERQSSPHPHCSIFDEDDKNLFIADLGTDTVYWYEVKYEGIQQIVSKKQCGLKMLGCGPRHLSRGQKGSKLLYLSGQLDSSIRILSYQKNKLQLLGAYRVSNNPTNFPSQILYKDNTVYMATRGDNYLIIFDPQIGGGLKQRFRFKVGEWPRHFNITKSGTIFIACQYQNIIQRFRIENGKVFQLGNLGISCPSCISFEQ